MSRRAARKTRTRPPNFSPFFQLSPSILFFSFGSGGPCEWRRRRRRICWPRFRDLEEATLFAVECLHSSGMMRLLGVVACSQGAFAYVGCKGQVQEIWNGSNGGLRWGARQTVFDHRYSQFVLLAPRAIRIRGRALLSGRKEKGPKKNLLRVREWPHHPQRAAVPQRQAQKKERKKTWNSELDDESTRMERRGVWCSRADASG